MAFLRTGSDEIDSGTGIRDSCLRQSAVPSKGTVSCKFSHPVVYPSMSTIVNLSPNRVRTQIRKSSIATGTAHKRESIGHISRVVERYSEEMSQTHSEYGA
jgi:hypothetical protein